MIYEQLEAACLPLIEAYQTDLTTHDKQGITDNPCLPFLHWTRACGTHILFLEDASKYPPDGVRVPYLFGTADRWHILRGYIDMAQYIHKENHSLAVHYYDGVKLRLIDSDRALQIARDYVKRIGYEWTNRSNANDARTVDGYRLASSLASSC